MLSQNQNVTWEIVQANPDKRWNYSVLSVNPNITCEIVQANPDKPWSYNYLSENPNITFEIIRTNTDIEWEYDSLSLNTFALEKKNFFRKKLQQWFKTSALKEELIAKLWHPSNFEKFKYYDPEMFDNEDKEDD